MSPQNGSNLASCRGFRENEDAQMDQKGKQQQKTTNLPVGGGHDHHGTLGVHGVGPLAEVHHGRGGRRSSVPKLDGFVPAIDPRSGNNTRRAEHKRACCGEARSH